jgi:hypothetical protein
MASRNTNILEFLYKSQIMASLGIVARKGTNYFSTVLNASIDKIVDNVTYALKYLTKS